MCKIIESSDYKNLTYFFYDNGLEIEPGIDRPDNVLKCWECTDPKDEKLIAAAALELRDNTYVVADIAVDEDYRGKSIGMRLMKVVEEEIIRLGGKEAWLVAKIPVYYKRMGWEIVEREKSPNITKCFTCIKYGNECKPQVMRKTL